MEHVGRRARDGEELLLGVQIRHGGQQRPGVGVLGVVEDLLAPAEFHDLPRVHHRHPVGHIGHHAQVVGDEDDGEVVALLDLVDELQNLGLDGHIQSRGGLVADQDLRVAGQGNGNNNALAHAAGELEGVLVEADLRLGDAHPAHQLQRPLPGLALGGGLAEDQGLHDLLADLHDGVEGGEGVLEHQGDLLPPDILKLPVGKPGQIRPVVEDLAPLDGAVARQDAQNRLGGHRLARAGLPHDGQRLPPAQVKGDVPHGVDLAGIGGEGNRQILYL